MYLSHFKVIRLLSVLTALSTCFLVQIGQAAELPNKVKNLEEIIKEINASGTSRVFVYVATGLDSKQIFRHLQDRALRDAMILNLRSRIENVMLSYFPTQRSSNGRIVKSLDTYGAFAADITAAEFEQLKIDPRVIKIEIDAFKKANLNQSLPLIGQSNDINVQPNGIDTNGTSRTIAVIDTGVQANHSFIGVARVVAEACFLTSALCPNGLTTQTGTGASAPASGEYHGTHVSGIAMGRYQSGSNVVNRGMASNANLVMINVFGSQGGAYTSDIILALQHVYTLATKSNPLPIDSVNMSLGSSTLFSGDCDGEPEKDVIDILRSAGVITTVAAGNSNSTSGMSSPGCISSAFSVGATNKTGGIASYTNISSTTDVFAPGGDSDTQGCIVSSILSGYGSACGTSMAAPHAAGAVALLRASKPTASITEIEVALRSSGTKVSDTRSGGSLSAPLINVANAIGILNDLQSYPLTTQVSGDGIVRSMPGGINCGTSCTASFVEGQTISLTAVPSATSVFNGWTGNAACSTSSSTCSFLVNAANTNSAVQANFTVASWVTPLKTALDSSSTWTSPITGDTAAWYGQNKTLRVSSDTTGYAISGDVADDQTSSMETQVTITQSSTLSFFWSVSSEASFDFLEFYINGVLQSGRISGVVNWKQLSFLLLPSTSPYTLRWVYRKDFSVSSNQDAGFVDKVTLATTNSTTNSLQLSKKGSSYGSVTSNPSGISCGTTCSSQTASFTTGQSVLLTASPISNRRFYRWSGACSGSSPTCSININANKNVTAEFR